MIHMDFAKENKVYAGYTDYEQFQSCADSNMNIQFDEDNWILLVVSQAVLGVSFFLCLVAFIVMCSK